MVEGKVFVKVKEPLLGIDICKTHGYETNNALWEAKTLHKKHGGNPVIVGVVTLTGGSRISKTVPRFKLLFPDEHIDYVRLDTFDRFFTLVPDNHQ